MSHLFKKICLCIIFSVTLLGVSSCSNNKNQEEIANIVQEFHNSNYEYIKTSITGANDDVTSIYYGKLIANPYEEYVHIDDKFSDSFIVQEMYYYENADGFIVQTKNADGSIVVQENINPPYPYYGYNKDLSFTFDRKETVDGVECDVYKTEYKDTVGGEPDRPNTVPIEVIIPQEYYINMDQKQVVRVDTDLRDLSKANGIINIMQSQGVSLETAKENASNLNFSNKEILEVFNVNGNIQIESLQ